MGVRYALTQWYADRFVPWAYRPLNVLVRALLRSRAHAIASWWVVELHVTGRRTGRTYAIPTSYRLLRDRDGTQTVEVCLSRNRPWWRNLTTGGEGHLLLRGREREATISVEAQDAAAIGAGLARRDALRRWLLPYDPQRAVLLRFTLRDLPVLSGR
ncbi:MAG: hypothetical protein VW450_08625 [Chloroflexota bacterium]